MNIRNTLRRLLVEKDGVSAIEYALIAALVAVAIIGAVKLLGSNVSSVFSTVATSI